MKPYESTIVVGLVIVAMAVFFAMGTPRIMDDGVQYEGFTESLAAGHLDFKTWYGFQGMSFFATPVYLLTRSPISIILVSILFVLLSIPLTYMIGRDFSGRRAGGIYFLVLFLLMPYPYVTLMRGFQEAVLLFFILLVIYGSIGKRPWPPMAWAVGGIVKPFALVMAPLFLKRFPSRAHTAWLTAGLVIGGLYLGISYRQTGHLLNDAAINSYHGNFDTGNPPPLIESFIFGFKGYLRVAGNLLVSSRKIILSPLVAIIGILSLWFNKNLKLRKRIIACIILNFVLVGSLTFSFAKYLLPATTLLALASLDVLLERRWLMLLVFLDSLLVFLPIWNYFGHVFWSSLPVFLLPFTSALVLYIGNEYHRYRHSHPYS